MQVEPLRSCHQTDRTGNRKDGLCPLQVQYRSDSMNAVGIDVSSRKSIVAVLRPLGEVVCLPFDVTFIIFYILSS